MRTIEHTSGISQGCSRAADSLRAEHVELLARLRSQPSLDTRTAFFGLVRTGLETRDPNLCGPTLQAYLRHQIAVTPTLVSNLGPGPLVGDPRRLEMLPVSLRAQWMAMAEGPPDPVASIMAPMMPVVFENVRML
jgi:hypothetical protein